MSKKSRRRNKKILAALALAGGAAMLGRGKGEISSNRPSGIDAALVASKAKDLAAPVVRESVPIGRMRGVGSDADAIAGQKIRANYAKRARINAINTAEGPPSIDNPYRAPINPGSGRINWRAKGGRAYKKGGRVTGIAKRGFGRALMKGKK